MKYSIQALMSSWVSRKEKLFLIKMLSVMFRAGLPAEEVFAVIIQQTEGLVVLVLFFISLIINVWSVVWLIYSIRKTQSFNWL